ncbi:thioredoxin family protein [Zhongshania sp. BJYM1]|jgi:glutaredoxin|uniref:thioredoxin family protein n=1 Tax=Zhongshania aquatica TaxID=2965069 RepID=UPI0022B3E936|nr:thioredoxin family protein [Marortus sp. BJYM1]
MKEITVLGSGCAKCIKAADLIKSVAAECKVAVNVTKETSPEVVMSYGVMSTPAIVIDDVLMHSGSIPEKETIKSWLVSNS